MADARKPQKSERQDTITAALPPVDIYESDDSAQLLVDLPGCDENSVEVRIEEGTLTITARADRPDYPGHELTYCEYRPTEFERSFSVSDMVDTEKVEATVKDGVLRLTLPKAEAAKPKKIEVKTA